MNAEDFRRFCDDYDVAFVVLSRDRAKVLARYTDRLASGYTLVWSGEGYAEQEYRCVDRIEAPRGLRGRPALINHLLRTLEQKVMVVMDDDSKAAYWLASERAVRLDSSAFLVMVTNLVVSALDVGAGLFGISEADIRYTSPLAPFHTRHAVTGCLTGIVGRGIWFDERNWTRADHDFALQHLKADRLSWKDNRYVVMHDLKRLPGGSMEFRDPGREQAEIANLKRWWGEDVITVSREDGSRVTVHVP